MKLFLTAPIPSKKNSRQIVRRGGRLRSVPSAEYAAWHDANIGRVSDSALSAGLMKGPLKISLRLEFPDKRRRDLDNALSSVLDLLVDGGVLSDDCWTAVPEISAVGTHGEKYAAEVEISPA